MSLEKTLKHVTDPNLQFDVTTRPLNTYDTGDQFIVTVHRAGTTTLDSYYPMVEMTPKQVIDSQRQVLLICRDPIDKFNSACRMSDFTYSDSVKTNKYWANKIGLNDWHNPNSQGMIAHRVHYAPYIKYFVNNPGVLTYRWDKFISQFEDRTLLNDPIGNKAGSKSVNIPVVPYPEIWEEEIQAYKYMIDVNKEGWLSG